MSRAPTGPVRAALLALNFMLVGFLAMLSVAIGIYGLSYAMLAVVPLLATAVLAGLGNALVARGRPRLGLGLMSIPLVVVGPLLVRIYGETVLLNLTSP